MIDANHVVVHVTPGGCSIPARDADGRVLLFGEIPNAESFARGLVEAGIPDAVLADLRDLDLLIGGTPVSEVATIFEDGVATLDDQQRQEAARQLGRRLAPLLMRLN